MPAAGEHVILSTATASGKTLAYNVPVLDALIADDAGPGALPLSYQSSGPGSAPQPGRFGLGRREGKRFGTYDGDTPREVRGRLRREASIVLTNPDMLHLGILPNHTLWADFFANLRYVVVDEAHVYRGVFGSHVACVLRRLWRVCARYGSSPQFIACSATIANPAEHLRRLAGIEAAVVVEKDDGAPRGARDFVLWNPPFTDRANAARRSANSEAARLFARLVQSGIRTITFAKARRVAELILLYARRILEDEAPTSSGRIRAYRAGYRPQDRREIERGLRPGGESWASRPPLPWSWALTSATWMRHCWWVIPAPLPACGSRPGGQDGARGALCRCSSPWTTPWTSISCAILQTSLAVPTNMR